MFNVINLASNALVLNDDGVTPRAFENGEHAALHAKYLTDTTGMKHQPRRVAIDNNVWRERERNRFASGDYIRLPWDKLWDDNDRYTVNERRYVWFYQPKEGSFEHRFAHASRKHPGKIAYTPDDASGQADRQTVCTPGRFLQTFYSHILQPYQIRDIATQYSAMFGSHKMAIANTREEVIHVYTNGPTSCMSHSTRDYASHVHPVAVYGDSPDLAVAYLTVTLENDDGEATGERITARTVIWPEHKLHSTIYGDSTRLEMHLREAGYEYGDMYGARLPKIANENGAGYVMPYIDNNPYLEDDGDYYVIVDDRSGVCANNTNGLINEGKYCEHCEDYHRADNFHFIHDVDEEWCNRCVRADAFWCEHYEQYYSTDVMVRMHNGETWCQDAFDNDGFVSDYDEENYDSDEAVAVINSDGDEVHWTRRQFQRYGRHCPHCDENVAREHVCDNAPECDEAPVDEATAVTPAAVGFTRMFPIGARVRRLSRSDIPMAATPEATATVTGYRTSVYWPGQELVILQWDDTPARNGQRDGDYHMDHFELVAPDLSALSIGDYVTVNSHNCLSVDIPAGVYRVTEINPDRRDDTLSHRHNNYIRCAIENLDDAYGLWIETSAIRYWHTAAQYAIARAA